MTEHTLDQTQTKGITGALAAGGWRGLTWAKMSVRAPHSPVKRPSTSLATPSLYLSGVFDRKLSLSQQRKQDQKVEKARRMEERKAEEKRAREEREERRSRRPWLDKLKTAQGGYKVSARVHFPSPSWVRSQLMISPACAPSLFRLIWPASKKRRTRSMRALHECCARKKDCQLCRQHSSIRSSRHCTSLNGEWLESPNT